MFDDAFRLRTALATLTVVVLVLTAGCAGVLGGDDGGSGTPTTTDGGATVTGTPGEGGLPPGVESGSVNASALVDAHDQSLSGTSFTTRLEFNQTQTRGNQSLAQRAVQTNRLASDGTFVTRFEQSGNTDVVQTTWGNDSVAVMNITFRDTTQYRTRDPATVRRNLTGRQFITQFVRMGDYSVESNEGGDVTLTASGPADSNQMGPNQSIESYEGTLVVGTDGRIERMEIDLVVESTGGVRTELSVDFEVVDVGSTTVEKPEWVSEGLAQASSGKAPVVN